MFSEKHKPCQCQGDTQTRAFDTENFPTHPGSLSGHGISVTARAQATLVSSCTSQRPWTWQRLRLSSKCGPSQKMASGGRTCRVCVCVHPQVCSCGVRAHMRECFCCVLRTRRIILAECSRFHIHPSTHPPTHPSTQRVRRRDGDLAGGLGTRVLAFEGSCASGHQARELFRDRRGRHQPQVDEP